MFLDILTIISNTAVLSIVGYVIVNYFKVKSKLYKMDAKELHNECDQNNEHNETKRERLSAIDG